MVALAAGLTFGCEKPAEEAAPGTPAAQKTPASKAAASKAATPKAAPASKAAAPASKAAPVSAAPTAAKGPLGAFAPLPANMHSATNPSTPAKVELGRMLYFETRISKNHDLSCNSCHNVDTFGVDNQPFSPGHKGQLGGRNSPTTFNAAGHLAQFWDGRSPDVEDQAKGPVLNPVEMAMADSAAVITVLKSIPGYTDAFKKAYPADADPITWDNYAKAVGAFERGLVTPSRFDLYLGGDKTALTDLEKKGLDLFVSNNCTMCHSGAYVGGQMYMKLGMVKAWPNLKDTGRVQATKNAADTHFFKVPSLRNVAKTGPYMHDGSIKDLKTAVIMMGEHQLGKAISKSDADAIVAFLESLTGKVNADYVKKPALPKSGPTTPKADPT
jgi:cytochrome c peroxidase